MLWGRIGNPSLRDIISHRAGLITAELSQELPEMDLVVRQAVLARNRYVHGSKGDFDYDKHPGLRIFLIDTLEFIFLASELVDTGWDIKRWASEIGCATHPLSRYLLGYSENPSSVAAGTSLKTDCPSLFAAGTRYLYRVNDRFRQKA